LTAIQQQQQRAGRTIPAFQETIDLAVKDINRFSQHSNYERKLVMLLKGYFSMMTQEVHELWKEKKELEKKLGEFKDETD